MKMTGFRAFFSLQVRKGESTLVKKESNQRTLQSFLTRILLVFSTIQTYKTSSQSKESEKDKPKQQRISLDSLENPFFKTDHFRGIKARI